MTDTTFEEAKRCPRCEQPGKESGTTKGPHGSTMHKFICMTPRCRWFNTGYVIQVNPDGTIPEAVTNRPHNFPALPPTGRTDAELENQLMRLYDQTLSGGETR